MKKYFYKLVLIIMVLFCIYSNLFAKESIKPPSLTKINSFVELEPKIIEDFDYYLSDLYNELNRNQDSWSILSKANLLDMNFKYCTSSTLKNYSSKNMFDSDFKTAWVEGKKGNGIGEWIRIEIFPCKLNKRPFAINEIAIIPGYLKNYKTWIENNRLREMTLIIETPKCSESQLTVFKLKFLELKDSVGGIQVFHLPDDIVQAMQSFEKQTLWLIIDEVSKGTKYSDTCISEIIISQTNK